MKITVITGSPRKNGTSNYMADEFIRGAEESGHEVYRFDSAKKMLNIVLVVMLAVWVQNPAFTKTILLN